MTANNAKWLDAMEGKPGNDDLKKELREVGINVPPVTFYKYSSSGHWNNTMRGVAAGKQFTVEQGKVYPIEILVSEGPGGEFGMTLLLEEVGMAPMSKDPKRELPSCPCSGPTTAFRNRTRTRNMCHLTKSALSGNPSNNRQFSVFLSPCPQETLWAFCLPVHKRYPTLPLQPCSLFDSIPSTSRASGADKV